MSQILQLKVYGECKENIGNALQESLTTYPPDINIVSEEGEIIPSNRSVLSTGSHFLAHMLRSIPCHCSSTVIILPYSAFIIRNLISVITFGTSSLLNREDTLELTKAATNLGFDMGKMNVVEQRNVPSFGADGVISMKDILSKFATVLLKKNLEALAGQQHSSPKLLNEYDSKHACRSNPRKRNKYMSNNEQFDNDGRLVIQEDEIIEITPEMYGEDGMLGCESIEEDDDLEMGTIGDHSVYSPLPAHFLIQGGDSNDSYRTDESWTIEGNGIDSAGDQSPIIDQVIDPSTPESKGFTCSFCPGMVFRKRNDVSRHAKKHVPIEKRKRFQCEQCKEKFINNSNLKVHRRVCTGRVREFKCKKCPDISYNKTDHLEHMTNVHNMSKKHPCPICHKQLKKSSDLKKHMATHSNQKPYVCDICGKRFKTESYVKVHRQAHLVNGHIGSNTTNVSENTNPTAEAIEERNPPLINCNGMENGGNDETCASEDFNNVLVLDTDGGEEVERGVREGATGGTEDSDPTESTPDGSTGGSNEETPEGSTTGSTELSTEDERDFRPVD